MRAPYKTAGRHSLSRPLRFALRLERRVLHKNVQAWVVKPGRLRSSLRYQKIPSVIHPALAAINLIATQTDDDANQFIAIGDETERVTTLGNIKLDVEIPQSIIDQDLQIKSDSFAGREEIANGVLSQVAAI